MTVLPGYRDVDASIADLDAWFADRDVQGFVDRLDRKASRQIGAEEMALAWATAGMHPLSPRAIWMNRFRMLSPKARTRRRRFGSNAGFVQPLQHLHWSGSLWVASPWFDAIWIPRPQC